MVKIPGTRTKWRAAAAALACGAALVAGCESSTTDAGDGETFVVQVAGEEFRIRTASGEASAALEARMRSGGTGVVLGTVVAGDGGFNAPWGWHLDPASIQVPDVAMELCDGRPSMVQENVPKWIAEVRVYCPWGAKVVRTE